MALLEAWEVLAKAALLPRRACMLVQAILGLRQTEHHSTPR